MFVIRNGIGVCTAEVCMFN